jgi:hypothetical protein
MNPMRLVAIAAGVIALFNGAALCYVHCPTIEERAAGADLIVVARAVDFRREPEGEYPALLDVQEVWKGSAPSELWVMAAASHRCDTSWVSIGETALFFLYRDAKLPGFRLHCHSRRFTVRDDGRTRYLRWQASACYGNLEAGDNFVRCDLGALRKRFEELLNLSN